MLNEFVWHGGHMPLPVEIVNFDENEGIEKKIRDFYNGLMHIRMNGVDVFGKAEMSWNIAMSRFGKVPQFIRNQFFIGDEALKSYFDALVSAGMIGWYRHKGYYCIDGKPGADVVWGFETDAGIISDVTGEEKVPSELEMLTEKIKELDKKLNHNDDQSIKDESSESASSSEDIDDPFLGDIDPFSPEPIEEKPVVRKKTFSELMRERRKGGKI